MLRISFKRLLVRVAALAWPHSWLSPPRPGLPKKPVETAASGAGGGKDALSLVSTAPPWIHQERGEGSRGRRGKESSGLECLLRKHEGWEGQGCSSFLHILHGSLAWNPPFYLRAKHSLGVKGGKGGQWNPLCCRREQNFCSLTGGPEPLVPGDQTWA